MPRPTNVIVGTPNHDALHNGDALAINRLGYDPMWPEFGAIGNNVADDGPAFNACRAACLTDGVPMVPRKPPVAYRFNTVWTVPASEGFRAYLGGWDTIYRAGAGLNDHFLKFDPTSGPITGAWIIGGTLDGNHSAQSSGGGCVYGHGAVQCRFMFSHYTNSYDVDLWLHEIAGGNLGHHNRVAGNLFDQSGTPGGHGQKLRMQSSDENWVEWNDFESWGGAGSEPYAIKDWAGIQDICHNVFVGGQEAVRIQDQSGTRVALNMFDGVGRTCVHIAGSGCIVTDNLFSGGGQTAAGTYSHIVQDGTGENQIHDNRHTTDATAGRLRSFIRELGASVNLSDVHDNNMKVNGALGTAKVERNAQTGNRYHDNIGYATANSGTTAFGAAVTSVTAIAHGLDVTPAARDFRLNFAADPLAAGHAWVSAITATTFTLNVKTAPGGAGTTVAWAVAV